MASRLQRLISFLESRGRGFLILIVAIGLLVATGMMASSEYRFIQTAARADGTVVRQNYGKHHVAIRFIIANGKTIEYRQNGFVSLEEGQNVTVLYDPNEPEFGARINTIGATWGNTIGFGGLGLFFLIGALLMIFRPEHEG